jgi:hypothetical protein
MVSMIVCCKKCGTMDESIIDISKKLLWNRQLGEYKPLSNYICDECIIEKREKLIISLTKKWWEFWK